MVTRKVRLPTGELRSMRKTRPAALGYILLCDVLTLLVLGWALLTALKAGDVFRVSMGYHVYLFVLMLAARLMAFSLGKANVTLDTPVIVASMFFLGPAATALVILPSWLGDGLYKFSRQEAPFTPDRTVRYRISRLFFAPLVTAFLGYFLAVGVEEVSLAAATSSEFLRLGAMVLWVTLVFIVVQYCVVLASYALDGIPVGVLVRETLLPGLVTEIALVPVAILLVSLLQLENPYPFLVLAFAYLVIANIFQRLASARQQTLRTVGDLQRLVRAGERVFAVLSHRQVLRQLTEAVHAEIPGADMAVAGIWDEEEDRYILGALDEDGWHIDKENARIKAFVDCVGHAEESVVIRLEQSGEERIFAIIPFVMDETPEGFIGAVLHSDMRLPSTAPTRDPGLYAVSRLRNLAAISAIAVHNARLYRLSTVDGLTGLYVRRYFNRRYHEEVCRALRHRNPLSLLVCDLDDFKRVNDSFGHKVGDRVLKLVGATCLANIRSEDVACRYGGDEFVILLPETDLDAAVVVAERVNQRIRQLGFLENGQMVEFSVSVGVSSFDPSRMQDVPDLVEHADQALYCAKNEDRKGDVVIAQMVGV